MKSFSSFLAFVLLCFGICGCNSKPPDIQTPYPVEKFLSRRSNLGEDSFGYRVHVPQNLPTGQPPAVMLYLHGAGNRGDDNKSQLNGLADQIERYKDKINFIIVIPQCLSDRFWDAQMLARANKALDDTVVEFEADPNKLYVSGFSLGGYGAWTIGAMYPEKFAALIPMSGRVLPRQNEMKRVSFEIENLANADDPYKAYAERIGKTSVWIFHGLEDTVVPITEAKRINTAFEKVPGSRVRFTEVEGAGHEPLAFNEVGFFDWLNEQKR